MKRGTCFQSAFCNKGFKIACICAYIGKKANEICDSHFEVLWNYNYSDLIGSCIIWPTFYNWLHL